MKLTLLLLIGCLSLLVLATGCSKKDVPADQFSAELVENFGENSRVSRMYVSGSKYRLEKEFNGNKLILLIDRSAGVAQIVSLTEQAYTEVPTTNPQLTRQDPFLAIDYIRLSGTAEVVGNESIDGYDCVKEVLSLNNREYLTIWTSTELNFPIKIVNHLADNGSMELKDIRREVVPDSLMVISDQFTRTEIEANAPTELPPWAISVPGAPLVQTPFERNVRDGDMIRLKIRPETSVWFTAEAIGSREADVRAIPFQHGQPIQNIDQFQNIVSENGRKFWRGETVHEANEIVIRAFTGAAKITCWSVSMRQKVLQQGATTIWRMNPELPIGEFRLVNSGGEEANISWDFYEDGEPMSSESTSMPVGGKITLAPHEVKLATVPVPGNEIHVRADKGQALLSLGQWKAE